MKRLIINADDYGLTAGCDRAIEAALESGAVTSTSCLIWRYETPVYPPALIGRCGVHLRLSDGVPVLPAQQVPSLVDRHGAFPRSRDAVAKRQVEPEEVRAEWRAQICQFVSGGLIPTHLDTHRHTHAIPALWDVYAELCLEYHAAGVPLSDRQREHLRNCGVRCPDYAEIRWTDGKYGTLEALLAEDFARYDTVHLMTHPGVVDEELRAKSSMVEVRARERDILTNPILREGLGNGVKFSSMAGLDSSPDPLAQIDLVFVAWNRRAFTVESLRALEANTAWARVRRVWLYDDGSEDGTTELLKAFAARVRKPCRLMLTGLRSPVAIMNDYLSRDPAAWWVKIDSDTVVPPGWLDVCLSVLRLNPNVDLLGIEAVNPPRAGVEHSAEPTGHIGGIGLMRTAAFTELPVAAGRLGFSDWQVKHPGVVKAWLNPGLPVILLDRLPFEPWASLSAEYEARGWQRPWKRYTEADSALWAWWRK